jgi:hypothetical protein
MDETDKSGTKDQYPDENRLRSRPASWCQRHEIQRVPAFRRSNALPPPTNRAKEHPEG